MATKFTFTYEDDGLSSKDSVVFTTEGTKNLWELLEKFECFLSASGYHFDGHLEFVDNSMFDDTPSWIYTDSPDYDIRIDDFPVFDGDLEAPLSSANSDIIKPEDC